MNDNMEAGADIHAGDGGYSEGTQEKYDAFVKNRNSKMNERIREITGQVLDELVPETWVALGYDKIKEIQYRTAELIVRECIREIGYKSVELLDIDFYPHYQERLKKYFGVEE